MFGGSVRVCGGLSVTMGGAGGSGVLRGCEIIVDSLLIPHLPLNKGRYGRPESQYESILAHGAGNLRFHRAPLLN